MASLYIAFTKRDIPMFACKWPHLAVCRNRDVIISIFIVESIKDLSFLPLYQIAVSYEVPCSVFKSWISFCSN